jgi:hypothetical protein
VVGLEEDTTDYYTFWLKKYEKEYEKSRVVEQGKNREKGGKEERKESDGERMEVTPTDGVKSSFKLYTSLSIKKSVVSQEVFTVPHIFCMDSAQIL